MSDLPDLNTGNISYIAYWNAIDQGGVSSIDPADVLSDGNIQEYTIYDNGVQIDKYNSALGRICKARVKADGWVIAYFDRTADFTQDAGSEMRGWWDLARDWTTGGTVNFTTHTLERVINSLQSQFSNSGTITYNTGDVSLYNYEYPNATATTGMSTYVNNGSGSGAGFSYSSSTTLDAAVAFGNGGDGISSTDSSYYFEGVLVYQDDSNVSYGALDLLENGLVPNSGTEYQINLSSGYDSDLSVGSKALGNVIVMWH